jgi:molecular chaperone DnaK
VAPPPPPATRAPEVSHRTTRVGRVVTKKRFTAMSPAAMPPATATPPVAAVAPPTAPTQMGDLGDVEFSAPRPAVVEVTASRLALSTIAGFCDEIIPAATPIPAHRTRLFATNKDGQRAVHVHVCQGESRRFADNMPLGTIVLDGLPPRPRGQVRIAVEFAIDDDGVLEASARDEQTGAAQSVRIKLST